MKTYEELLADLAAMKDERYRVFSERIVNVPAVKTQLMITADFFFRKF